MLRRPPPLAVDALLWVALVTPAAVYRPPTPWQGIAAAAALAVAVGVSRTRPVLALLVTAAVAVLGLAESPGTVAAAQLPALAVMSHLLGLRARRALPAALAFAAIALVGAAVVLVNAPRAYTGLVTLVAALVFVGVPPWLFGRYRRLDRELRLAGWGRAEQLEREQRHAVERERLRERTRIAQDMHDSLGHELSLIALRAGALQVAPGLAAEHRTAAGELRAAAADATDRLREIVGVLREAGDDGPPLTPAGESVEALVRRAADSGLAVTLRRAADGGDGAPPPLVDRAAHRVVQEALTNAARHAPGAPVAVTVLRRRAETEVTIANGPPPRPGEAAPRTGVPSGGDGGPPVAGTGLLGLRERVRLLGGHFRAGPRPDGGFAVTARFPDAAPPRADSPYGAGGSCDACSPCGAGGPYGGAHGPYGEPESPRLPEPAPQPEPVPAAARARAAAERTVRRGLLVAIGVPGALAAVLLASNIAWNTYTAARSVLPPADYERLRIGQPYGDVAPVLPPRVVTDTARERAPAAPPGADCRYYRESAELFVWSAQYRLCFVAGRLATKDRIAPGDPDGSLR
ncbi:sensor histidine kinase [Streptomyces sp. URMC 123]|uniref:sensor histidine kinase n=1 Tax=Streptomyces sp. URMC 123 TaxID=3423403 RepID=UPI003F1DCE7E